MLEACVKPTLAADLKVSLSDFKKAVNFTLYKDLTQPKYKNILATRTMSEWPSLISKADMNVEVKDNDFFI